MYLVVQNPKALRLKDAWLGIPNQSKPWLLEFIHKTGPWRQGHARGRPAATTDEKREGMRFLSRVFYHLCSRKSENLVEDNLVDAITIILCLQRRIWTEKYAPSIPGTIQVISPEIRHTESNLAVI